MLVESCDQIVASTGDNVTNLLSKEQEPIPESFDYTTNEGKNVLSTWIHGIEKIPPFSWLEKVAKLGERGANKIIEGLSFITNKLGGGTDDTVCGIKSTGLIFSLLIFTPYILLPVMQFIKPYLFPYA